MIFLANSCRSRSVPHNDTVTTFGATSVPLLDGITAILAGLCSSISWLIRAHAPCVPITCPTFAIRSENGSPCWALITAHGPQVVVAVEDPTTNQHAPTRIRMLRDAKI
jgi:hypothetical protein